MDNEIKDEDYQYDNGFHPKKVNLKDLVKLKDNILFFHIYLIDEYEKNINFIDYFISY